MNLMAVGRGTLVPPFGWDGGSYAAASKVGTPRSSQVVARRPSPDGRWPCKPSRPGSPQPIVAGPIPTACSGDSLRRGVMVMRVLFAST